MTFESPMRIYVQDFRKGADLKEDPAPPPPLGYGSLKYLNIPSRRTERPRAY